MRRNIHVFLLTILFAIIWIKCGEPLPNDYGGKIISIKFGTDWDASNGTLLNMGTSFGYGINKVYYEIKFQGASLEGVMVRKKWQLPFDESLKAVTFMPEKSKRICGELHYHDLRIMDAGNYQISVYYFEDDEFKEYPYAEGVNRQFTIE